MKKILLSCLMVLAAIFATLPAPHCSAADVWVAHWNSENIDIYVEDDTLRYDTTSLSMPKKYATAICSARCAGNTANSVQMHGATRPAQCAATIRPL